MLKKCYNNDVCVVRQFSDSLFNAEGGKKGVVIVAYVI